MFFIVIFVCVVFALRSPWTTTQQFVFFFFFVAFFSLCFGETCVSVDLYRKEADFDRYRCASSYLNRVSVQMRAKLCGVKNAIFYVVHRRRPTDIHSSLLMESWIEIASTKNSFFSVFIVRQSQITAHNHRIALEMTFFSIVDKVIFFFCWFAFCFLLNFLASNKVSTKRQPQTANSIRKI